MWERALRAASQRERLGVSPEVSEGAACVGTLQMQSAIKAALLWPAEGRRATESWGQQPVFPWGLAMILEKNKAPPQIVGAFWHLSPQEHLAMVRCNSK